MNKKQRFILCFAAMNGRAIHNKQLQKALLIFDQTAKEAEVGQILYDLKQQDLISPLGDGQWIVTFDGSAQAAKLAVGGGN